MRGVAVASMRLPVGEPFTAATLKDAEDRRGAHWTDSDILLVYAPGSSPDERPATMAKFVPAGSDLVFQMHYTTNGKAVGDQSRVGLADLDKRGYFLAPLIRRKVQAGGHASAIC